MARKRKVKTLIQNIVPPPVEIGGQKHQFRSLLELRFAFLLQRLVEAGEIESWMYEPTTIEFPGYKNRPKSYTPDFAAIKGEETTIYEGMAYITPQYVAKFKRLKERHGDWKVVIFMDKPDTDKKRKPKYERVVDQKLVEHIWYVGEDFKRLGIEKQAADACFAAGQQGVEHDQTTGSETPPAEPPADTEAHEAKDPATETAEQKFAFQKISSVGKVKTYKRTEKGIEVAFKDLHFSDGHRELLDYWMDEHVKLRVTLEEYEQVQPREKPEASLFDRSASEAPPPEPEAEAQAEPQPEGEPAENQNEPGESLIVPLPSQFQAHIKISLSEDGDGLWHGSFRCVIPDADSGVRNSPPLVNRAQALKWADAEIGIWLQQQSHYKHRRPCEQQVTDWVSMQIAEMEKPRCRPRPTRRSSE